MADVVSEVGSGLDGERPKLATLLRGPRVADHLISPAERVRVAMSRQWRVVSLTLVGRYRFAIYGAQVPPDSCRGVGLASHM